MKKRKSNKKVYSFYLISITIIIIASILLYLEYNKVHSFGKGEIVCTVTHAKDTVERKHSSAVIWKSIEKMEVIYQGDTVILVQGYHGALPGRRRSELGGAFALLLAFSAHRIDGHNTDIEELFHGPLDLHLVGVRGHAEQILVLLFRKARALFRQQNPLDYIS